MQPREQPHRLLVGGEMGMDRAVDADLAEAKNRMVDRPFLEQRDQLVAQPLRREVADESHVNAAPGKPLGVVVHAEAEAVLVADRAKDPRRVVDEREVVEHADPLRF